MESAIAALLAEMKQGNVHEGELESWATQVEDKRPALAAKLRQLAEVVQHFERVVEQRFEDPQDTMLSMAQSVRDIEDLRGAQVYVDAFYGFTAVEREVLRGLVEACPRVTITLVLDRSLTQAIAALKTSGHGGGRCAPSMETLEQLLRLSEQVELVDVPARNVDPEQECPSRFAAPEIAHLARNFLSSPAKAQTIPTSGTVRFIEACDTRDQARWAAEQVEQWHRDEGWHWGEMAIIARDLEQVAQEMEEALAVLRVPHFIDRNQPQETHPLIQGTLAALDTILRGWRQETVLAFAKSGLYDFDSQSVARLEWFVLKYPRKPEEWKSARSWESPPARSPFDPEDLRVSSTDDIRDLDSIRQEVIQPLLQLERRLDDARNDEGGIPTSKVIEAICHLIHEAMTPRLDGLRIAGRPDEAAEEESLLKQAGRLLETIAVSAGTETFETAVLLDLLRSALGCFRLHRIPPVLNQLVVAQIDRSRLPEVKGVVIIGMAEGQFPASGSNRSLLSDEERELIGELGSSSGMESELRNSSRRMFLREGFLAWMAITRASDALTLIKPMVSKEGEALNNSPWWDEILSLLDQPEVLSSDRTHDIDRVARAREAASFACTRWAGTRERFPRLSPETIGDFSSELSQDRSRMEFDEVIRWAYRRNTAELSPVTVGEALTDRWAPSATALEAFAACPFKFFMHTIMRPDVRQDIRVNPMDLGNLAHAVLKSAFEYIESSRLTLYDLDDSELEDIIRTCSELPLQRLQLAGLLTNPIGKIQAELFLEQVTGVLRHSRDLSRHMPVRTLVMEKRFSEKASDLAPPTVTLTLPSGSTRTYSLRGQIDRIDAWGDAPWLFVMDYKSSPKTVDWTLLLNGISLQLPVYLLVLEANQASLGGADGRMGGAFFKPVNGSKDDKKRMRGLIAASAFADLHLANSETVFVTIGKTPNQGDLITDEELESLTQATHRRLQMHLQGIVGGSVGISPYRKGTEGPCKYCNYRMACRLDFSMNSPTLLSPTQKQRALESLGAFAKEEAS
jgi:ATP-dependent helicase/nuclease subunit B